MQTVTNVTPQHLKDLQALGFRPAKKRLATERRLWVGSEGLKRTGKTDFMLRTTPGPVAHINIDLGTDDVEEKMVDMGRRDIFFIDIRMPVVGEDKAIDMAKETWNRILVAMHEICTRKLAKTVCLDTGDAVWKILRLAVFERLEKIPQQRYDQVNLTMSNLLMAPQNHGLNMICGHRLGQTWVDTEYQKDGKTVTRRAWNGEYEREGYKHTDYTFRINIRHLSRPKPDRYDVKLKKTVPQVGLEFGAVILDCTANPDLAGTEIWGEDLTFQNLGLMAYPNSEYEDWL